MGQMDLNELKIEREARPLRPGRRRWRLPHPWWLLSGLLLLAGAGWLVNTRLLHPVVSVQVTTVATAYPSQAITQLTGTGYVVAQRKADVASKGTGRLVWIGVTEGSQVRQGQVIARLDNQDVAATAAQSRANLTVAQAALAQAQAELHDAQVAATRSKALVGAGFVSQAADDAAQARLEKAQAGVHSAQAAIRAAEATRQGADVAVDYTLIRAPFDGVITAKNADVGDIVAPFASALQSKGAVVSMADLNTLVVDTDVSETSLHFVSLRQPCEIQLDALPGTRLRGEVTKIVPRVDRARATVLVKVRLVDHDPRLLPDMSARVAFLSRPLAPEALRPVTAVARAAIVQRDGHPVAFVIDHATARQVPVETGQVLGDQVQIRQGLRPGDPVVANPPAQLTDGTHVAPAKT